MQFEMKKRATKEDKERAKRQEKENRNRPAESEPYRGSDGYWRRWINDGRGGYDELLPMNEQSRREYDGGR